MWIVWRAVSYSALPSVICERESHAMYVILPSQSLTWSYAVVSEDEGVACLVMQYASGGDLLERIVSTGPLTEKVTAAIAEHLLHALDHMHSKGVIHRDLKPENVLFAK